METINIPASQPLELGMLIYPHMTLLDLAGPQAVLGFHGRTHLVAKTRDPVLTDTGISVLPTTTFTDCPENLDVLFVPGGFGTNQALQEPELLKFLASRGKNARYVTSVCSGSILLAAAGLLDGYKAATHWALYEQLKVVGEVDAVRQRVVVDRNRFTGGGVTAGIDFGLTLLAALKGDEVAKMTQLMLEYDPRPPFDAGTPDAAGPAVTAMAQAILQESVAQGIAIAHNLYRERRAMTEAV